MHFFVNRKWSSKLLFDFSLGTQKNTYAKPSKGAEKWAWSHGTLKPPGKKSEQSKKSNKPKVDILKRKYWYEEPKPLKFCEFKKKKF